MEVKKMNKLQKILLKMKSTPLYKKQIFLEKLQAVGHPTLGIEKNEYHFKHSGNSGDIIYALPCIIALAKGKKAHLHLQIDQKGAYGKNPHPLGDKMLTDKMVQMLKPLLENQSYFLSCHVYDGSQPIDYDLDIFRDYPWNVSKRDLCRWYFLAFATNYELQNPWLKVSANTKYSNAIVVARSQRYNAAGIDYSFLRKYNEIYFVGVKEEFEIMQQMVPQIVHQPVNNFLEMAAIIAGSKLFIGNQSFPFSIAEAMKINRMLEVDILSPNVNVTGPGGYDFCFQPQFEKLVHDLAG